MQFEIMSVDLLGGYVVNSVRAGDTGTVSVAGFVSSEDGDELITKLEGLPDHILSKLPLPSPVSRSAVDTLLAIIRKDMTATVYLNEVPIVQEMRFKRPFRKGDLIRESCIVDMGRVEFSGVHVPPDAGVVFVFSVGWRKGLFYDLSPLHDEEGKLRQYDLEEQIGSLYAYLTFQERFKIDENTWRVLLDQKWFPFAYLDDKLLRKMISYAKEGWNIDDLLPEISADVQRLLKDGPLNVANNPILEGHAEFLAAAVERYQAGDYISCASNLYPRIEGLLRSFSRTTGNTSNLKPETLIKVAVEYHQSTRLTASLLLPAKFKDYVDTIYFANFDPGSAPDVSRHSVAHGEARPDDFSLKTSTIAFLIIYQLSLFFSDGRTR